MLESTAAILMQADQVFIARKGADGRFAGLWEFPGGKIDPGETAEECIKRELYEEFLITIDVIKHCGEIIHTFPEGQIRIHAYLCQWSAGEIHLTEHAEYAWVPLSQLDCYQLTPADRLLADKLLSKARKNKSAI